MKLQELQSIINALSVNYKTLLTKYESNPEKFGACTSWAKPIVDAIKNLYPNYPFYEAIHLLKEGRLEGNNCPVCDTKLEFRKSVYSYKKFCSNECKVQINNPNSSVSVTVDEIEYPTIKDAFQSIGITRQVMRERLLSKDFPSYVYTKNHEQTCIDLLSNTDPRLLDIKTFENIQNNNNQSQQQLADELGISRSSLFLGIAYHSINETKEQVSEYALTLKNDKIKMEELYKTLNTDEISKLYDVTPKTIQNWIRLHDIPMDYSKMQSEIERTLIAYIQEVSPNTTVLTRDTETFGFEVDIYVPEFNFAIECDGLRYHSEIPTSKHNKKRHQFKQQICYKNGVVLLRFTDVGETIPKLDIVKSMIYSKLKLNKKIHARKCNLVDVSGTEAMQFFNNNHISGGRPTSMYIGLEYDNELVMVMSFGKSNTAKKYDWEIIRMASKIGVTVVGGASKIFHKFVSETHGTIMSYANLRFGTGKSYEKLGFKFVNVTEPGYMYTNMKNVFSRYQFQKSTIQNFCKIYDSEKSEYENAEINGYTIYWDCGHGIYEYNRK